MEYPVEGFALDLPAGYRVHDVTVSFITGMPDRGPSPSLIVQSKPARPGLTLETAAAETLAELLQTIPGMAQGSKGELTFDDGGKGILLSYSMPSGRGELRQYFALRLVNGRLCTATLTAPVAGLSEAAAKAMIACLKSIKPKK
jgi:hypothetical protein